MEVVNPQLPSSVFLSSLFFSSPASRRSAAMAPRPHVYISAARECAQDTVLAEEVLQHLRDDHGLRVFSYD